MSLRSKAGHPLIGEPAREKDDLASERRDSEVELALPLSCAPIRAQFASSQAILMSVSPVGVLPAGVLMKFREN